LPVNRYPLLQSANFSPHSLAFIRSRRRPVRPLRSFSSRQGAQSPTKNSWLPVYIHPEDARGAFFQPPGPVSRAETSFPTRPGALPPPPRPPPPPSPANSSREKRSMLIRSGLGLNRWGGSPPNVRRCFFWLGLAYEFSFVMVHVFGTLYSFPPEPVSYARLMVEFADCSSAVLLVTLSRTYHRRSSLLRVCRFNDVSTLLLCCYFWILSPINIFLIGPLFKPSEDRFPPE